MSRYRSPSRALVGLATLACFALSLSACAHAVDDSAADTFDSSTSPTAGAPNSSGNSDQGGSPGAGLGNTNGGGDITGQAQGGRADDGGAPGSGGAAGAGSSSAAGSHAAGASSVGGANAGAGRGGSASGGGDPGSGGNIASGGNAGGRACKVTTDLNVYTPTNTGCGGYAACKGQIHWRNDEAQALTKIVLSFSVAAGSNCITDNSSSKWTIADNGATSQRCVFTASGAAWSVDSKSALSFGYDTTQTGTTAATDISVADPSCN